MTPHLHSYYLKRFRDDETLTPGVLLTDQIHRLRVEGWRWGYEKNDQIKTDPRMALTPVAAQFLSDLEIIHQEATMSTQRPHPEDPHPEPKPPEPDDPNEPDDEDSEGDAAKLKQIRE